jgi:hypothetical protein
LDRQNLEYCHFAFVLLRIFLPDPNATESLAAVDWLLLSLWAIAILGLVAAWRWELVGGLITIIFMFNREICWLALKGYWTPSFLIVWFFIIPPAVLFIVASQLERRMN